MNGRNSNSGKGRSTRERSKRSSQGGSNRTKGVNQSPRSRRFTLRQQVEKLRCLAAINQVRRGHAKSVSAAARAEETTIRAIRMLVPGTITQVRRGGRIRVKPSDRYSARVEI